jgi:CRP-like cAMP-binding protein
LHTRAVIHTGVVRVFGMAPKDPKHAENTAKAAIRSDEQRAAENSGIIAELQAKVYDNMFTGSMSPSATGDNVSSAEGAGPTTCFHSLGPGDIFGLSHRPAPVFAAVAKNEVKVCWIPRDRLARIMQSAFEEAARSHDIWLKDQETNSPRAGGVAGFSEKMKLTAATDSKPGPQIRTQGQISGDDFSVSKSTSQMVSQVESNKTRLGDIGRQLSEQSVADQAAAAKNMVDIKLAAASGGVRADAVSTMLARVR